jgi:serine protease SohB
MDAMWDLVDFATKGLVVLVIFWACALVLFRFARQRRPDLGALDIREVNGRVQRLADVVRRNVLDPRALRQHRRERARSEKAREKAFPTVFVLDFKGDMAATQVRNLRHEVTTLLTAARQSDEIVIRLESPGGTVTDYGLAASQLARIRERGIRLVVCVDKMAASGGYLMACVADEILAAPFAIIGSIGVAAPMPNLHRALRERGIDFEEYTAGEYKRTVTILGEITDKGRKKFQEQIEDTHRLFKEFVHKYRPQLDIDRVATGEYWHATRALELGLINRIMTSDDYLLSKLDVANVLELRYTAPRNLRARLAGSIASAVDRLLLRLWSRAEAARFQ